MNTGTLVSSLVFAAVLVVIVALLMRQMVRGWVRRSGRQTPVLGPLPALPDTVGPETVAPTRGLYVGSVLVAPVDASPSWLDRVAVGDLGYRAKAVLTRYPEGIMCRRSGAVPLWLADEAIVGIRTERRLAGKVLTGPGILTIRWRLPSGIEIDTGFRGDDDTTYGPWLGEAR